MKAMKHNIILKLVVCVSLLSVFHIPLSAQVLSLDSCLALARRNNADIRASQLAVQKAQAVKDQVFTKYFPSVQFHDGQFRCRRHKIQRHARIVGSHLRGILYRV